MNPLACILPLPSWRFRFQLPLTGTGKLNYCFLAVNGSDEDARIIDVLVPICVLLHDKRPFALATLLPGECQAGQIIGKIESHNRCTPFLERVPEYLLHEFGA